MFPHKYSYKNETTYNIKQITRSREFIRLSYVITNMTEDNII